MDQPVASFSTGASYNPKYSYGTSSLPVNTWTHLAATYDGSTFVLYMNGVQVGSTAVTGGITTSNGVLHIGGNAVWGGEYFAGLIDEVRIYSRALNVGEIMADMSSPIGGSLETTAPVVAMTNASGPVSGTVTLAATASDNVAVAGVQFLVNGQQVGTEDST